MPLHKRQNRHTEISAMANENRVGSVVTMKLKIFVSHEEESVAKEHERHMIKYVQRIAITDADKNGNNHRV